MRVQLLKIFLHLCEEKLKSCETVSDLIDAKQDLKDCVLMMNISDDMKTFLIRRIRAITRTIKYRDFNMTEYAGRGLHYIY